MPHFAASIQIESHQLAEYFVHAIADAVRQLSHNQSALAEISAKLDLMHKEIKNSMAAITLQLDKLDTATNAIAAELKRLRDSIANSVTPEELARFDAQIATLESMGKDPGNPLPTPVPVP